MEYTYQDIAKMIDHSLLNPVLTDGELAEGCQIAAQYGVASVCIKPYFVAQAAKMLRGSGVKTGTTIGFPHGGHVVEIKVAEVERALADGAEEVDMVVNIGKVLTGDWDYVRKDIEACVSAAHAGGAVIKVIFENCFLKDEHKIRLCGICGEVGADFVKTSTGYGDGGAKIDDLKLMRKHSPPAVQVKAAGGVRTLDDVIRVRQAGVTRIGATRTVEILQDCSRQLEK
ncbi:MAG: deoxyribose-phosphate aldolase [Planctomycetota bacterium]|nr:deoxyribose-phosphate aldolase [Planctomycetota bacterium]